MASILEPSHPSRLFGTKIIDNGCKDLPPHVVANCSEQVCTLSCEEGYAFASANTTIDVLYPCIQPTLPECSDTEEPNYIVQEGTFTITPAAADLCNNSEFLSQVKSSVRQSLTTVCSNISNNCTVGVDAECEDFIGFIEEESNQVIGRRKRSVPQRNIKVYFKLTGKLGEGNVQDKLTSLTKSSSFCQNITVKKLPKISLKPPNIVCPAGTIYKRSHCVKCPAGTYWREEKHDCVACSFGTYQPLASQKQCLPCPKNTSTRKLHAKHIHACRDICQPGTFGSRRGRHGLGRLGVKPCSSCPIGWYQPHTGSLSCMKCGNNMTTSRRRTIYPEDCHADPQLCQMYTCMNNGTCVAKEKHITCICKTGFIGSRCEFRKNECLSMPCLHEGSCSSTADGHICSCSAGFSGNNCQGLKRCRRGGFTNLNCLILDTKKNP